MMQLFVCSLLAYRDESGQTVMQHMPAVMFAGTEDLAIEKARQLLEQRFPEGDGWAHSVTRPNMVAALVAVMRRGVN